jgi:putative membrane protein
VPWWQKASRPKTNDGMANEEGDLMENESMNVNTRLAYDRTRLAHDRTLMAWVRTSTSLISFGFTIYKFFQQFHQAVDGAARKHLLGSREFALMMIVIGLFALLVATVQNHIEIKRLRAQGADIPRSLTVLVALLISVLGIVALLAVTFRE